MAKAHFTELTKEERYVRFARLTGLRQANHAKAFRYPWDGYRCKHPPEPSWKDHTKIWSLGTIALEKLILTTEPYCVYYEEISEWCERYDWQFAVYLNAGMWNPPATSLIVFAKDGNPHFEEITRILDARLHEIQDSDGEPGFDDDIAF